MNVFVEDARNQRKILVQVIFYDMKNIIRSINGTIQHLQNFPFIFSKFNRQKITNKKTIGSHILETYKILQVIWQS